MRRMRAAVLMLSLAATVSACSSSNPTATPATPTTVTPPASVVISGQFVLTGLRQRSQLTLTANMTDGTTQDVTASAIWQVADTSVAVVSSTGVITTIAAGTTRVAATYQTISDAFDLVVQPVTTTITGGVITAAGQTGTFTLAIAGAVDPTTASTSSQVSGSLQFPGVSVPLSGLFQSATGAITFQAVGAAYRFNGTIADGFLTGTFTDSTTSTGSFSSTSITVK